MRAIIFIVLVIELTFICPAAAQHDLSYQYWVKAEKLAVEGKSAESLTYYEKAYSLVKRSDPFRAANLCNDMSSVHYAENRFETSMSLCQRGLAHLKNKPNAPDSLYFKLYTSTATMYSSLNNRDSSNYFFEAADAVLDKNQQVEKQIPLYVLHHYLHQGRSFWELHRYHQSLTYFDKARSLSETYHLSDELPFIESSIAEVYDLLGEHRKALKYRLAAASTRGPDPRWAPGYFAGVSYTYQRLNNADSALLWQRKAWQAHIRQPARNEHYKKMHMDLLLLAGSIHRAFGRHQEALLALRAADSYQAENTSRDKLVPALILIEKGHIAQSRQQFTQAAALYNQAFKTLCLTGNEALSAIDVVFPSIALRALQLRGSLLFKQFQLTGNTRYLADSYQLFSKLINLKRDIYANAADEVEERHLLSSEGQDVFKDAIPVAFAYYRQAPDASRLNEIFNWFEEANATYLYDVINYKKTLAQQLPAAVLEESRTVLMKRAGLARTGSLSPAEHKELEELRFRWYKLKQTIHNKYPDAVVPAHKPVSFAAIQRKLDKQSAFVSYKWFGSQMFAFIITADTSRLVSWNVNQKLLGSYLNDLKKQFDNNPGFGKYYGINSGIGACKLLFEPVKKWLPSKNRLIIARDWQFNFLPFELLETGMRQNDFLAKQYAFSYTYSASFFWKHPFQNQQSTDDKNNVSLVVAPFVAEQELPDTKWSAVSKLEDISQLGSQISWGANATKQKFLKSGLNREILHFATHAHTADDNPNDSYIQFFPGIDSRLYLDEIYALPLNNTRLIVLSACSAGSGKNLRGEGNISLAHAISQAGCPSVITTTWEANDVVSNYLSIRLHKYIRQGMALDVALQKARIDFFEDSDLKKYGHPYYWANLTLIGINEPVYEAGNFPFGLAAAAVAILIFILAIAWIIQRKGRTTW